MQTQIRPSICLLCSNALRARHATSRRQARALATSSPLRAPSAEATAPERDDRSHVQSEAFNRSQPRVRFDNTTPSESAADVPRTAARSKFGQESEAKSAVEQDLGSEKAVFEQASEKSSINVQTKERLILNHDPEMRNLVRRHPVNVRKEDQFKISRRIQRPVEDTSPQHWSNLPKIKRTHVDSKRPATINDSTAQDDDPLADIAKWKARRDQGRTYVPLNTQSPQVQRTMSEKIDSRDAAPRTFDRRSNPADSRQTSQDRNFQNRTSETQPWQRSRGPIAPASRSVDLQPGGSSAVSSRTAQTEIPDHHPRFGNDQEQSTSRERGRRDTYNAAPRRRERGGSRRAEKFASFDDEIEEVEPNFVSKKEIKKQRKQKNSSDINKQAIPIMLPPFMSVRNLVAALHVEPDAFLDKVLELGFEDLTMDHVINAENAGLIAMEYNYEPIVDRSETEDLKARAPVEDKLSLPRRPPVVTIMGHVDHGKTTLLDYLRKSSVAASEHGGITQHIGAFSVPMATGKTITFLDTPGHSAFLSMRQRGANVTDIVILVVAADDSVKPQTIEAIKHAKAANVPVIVAINKIDKEDADANRVKQDLLRHEIEVEDFGGDVQAVEVSGKTGRGMDELEESASTLAEILDLRAEKVGLVEGWVLEATTKKSGRVATVLVRRGTLRVGDTLVAGQTWTRVRTLRNEAGELLDSVEPGYPVEVDGWRDQPVAGDEVLQAPTEQKATSVVSYRSDQADRLRAAADIDAINEARREHSTRRTLDAATALAAKTTPSTEPIEHAPPAPTADPVLYLIIKADVSGSAEAVQGTLSSLPLSSHSLSLSFLRTGVGAISESDIAHLAAVPHGTGYIINFNQPVPSHIATAAARARLTLVDENIIYKAVDAVTAIVESHLPPLITRKVVGDAEGAAVFEIKGGATGVPGGRRTTRVLGCRVRNGVIARGARVRVFRGAVGDENSVVWEGKVGGLKSHKKDVESMRKGAECGVTLEGWDKFEVGDVLQCFEETREKRRLV